MIEEYPGKGQYLVMHNREWLSKTFTASRNILLVFRYFVSLSDTCNRRQQLSSVALFAVAHGLNIQDYSE